MSNFDIFNTYSEEYEQWFERNHQVYLSELNAIREMLPAVGSGLEVGVGSGRFAVPLGIKTGVEPSHKMAAIARERGVDVFDGVAESLPFEDSKFDFILMVTTICFVDNVNKAMREANRVLRQSGSIIVAFVDKDSELGMRYQRNKDKSKFYQTAKFFSTQQVVELLKGAGFYNFEFRQTVFSEQKEAVQACEEGFGKGSFIVIKASKTN